MNWRRSATWWLCGGAAGAAVLGPALAPGSLLSLDLVLTPRLPLPSGTWGLGPELPQRVPLGIPLAWLAAATTGPVAGKLLIAAAIAAAFAGMARLTAGLPTACRFGAALLYALGPYPLTRVGAGHLNVLAAYALLPFVVPVLVRPRRWERAFLAGLALAVTGSAGGSLALLALGVALVADRDRRALRAFGAGVAAQALWIVPNVVALASGAAVAGAEAFPTRAHGLAGVGLLAGDGFWRASSQVGSDGTLAVVGLLLLGLALVGHRRLPIAWRGRLAALAAVGLAIAVASAVPGVRGVFDTVTDTPLGTPFREGHRAIALYLLWAIPAAAAGATVVAERIGGSLRLPALAVPAALALVLAAPGVWGVDGRLSPVEFPPGWADARAQIEAEGEGTVLALPWHEYLDLGFADGRRVLNPLPAYLDRDVISSFDPEVGPTHQEQNDPRAGGIQEVVAGIQAGQPAAAELVERGVRWVVLLHEVDSDTYASLRDDPGLALVTSSPSVDLFEVRGWPGHVVAPGTGEAVPSSSLLRPWLRTSAHAPTLWPRPAQGGWLRGWTAADEGTGGRLLIPGGDGPIWFWPAVVVIGADIAVAVLAVLALRSWLRTRRGTVCTEGSLPPSPTVGTVRPTNRQAEDPS